METAGNGECIILDFTGNPLKCIELIQELTANLVTIDKNLTASVAIWIDFNRNREFNINKRVPANTINVNNLISRIYISLR
ncbi:hypothetical protein [Chryseobacterium sp. M5A1_1a]